MHGKTVVWLHGSKKLYGRLYVGLVEIIRFVEASPSGPQTHTHKHEDAEAETTGIAVLVPAQYNGPGIEADGRRGGLAFVTAIKPAAPCKWVL